jgi:hypothetical protein
MSAQALEQPLGPIAAAAPLVDQPGQQVRLLDRAAGVVDHGIDVLLRLVQVARSK